MRGLAKSRARALRRAAGLASTSERRTSRPTLSGRGGVFQEVEGGQRLRRGRLFNWLDDRSRAGQVYG